MRARREKIPLEVHNNVPYLVVGDADPAAPATVMPPVWGPIAATCAQQRRRCYRPSTVPRVWDSDEERCADGQAPRPDLETLPRRVCAPGDEDYRTELPEPRGDPQVLGPGGDDGRDGEDEGHGDEGDADVGREVPDEARIPLPAPADEPDGDAPGDVEGDVIEEGEEPVAEEEGGGTRNSRKREAQSLTHKLTRLSSEEPFLSSVPGG